MKTKSRFGEIFKIPMIRTVQAPPLPILRRLRGRNPLRLVAHASGENQNKCENMNAAHHQHETATSEFSAAHENVIRNLFSEAMSISKFVPMSCANFCAIARPK